MTEEKLNRERKRVARQAARTAIEQFRDVLREIREEAAFLTTGIVSKKGIADMYGISVSHIEVLDREHEFKRVEGSARDRNWYDLEDVRNKIGRG